MKLRIILDSTANLRPGLEERFAVLPLTLRFGEEEYLDGVTMDARGFYEKLVESDVMPTTSQASPYAFEELFRKELEQADELLVLTLSARLSGTYQSACIAAEEFAGRVRVVDSRSVSIGTGILAEYALRLAEEGLGAAAIAEKLEARRDDVRVLAVLNTLEYLRKGGRISKSVALAGELLGIKPVACLRDGAVEVLGKARGSRQGNNYLMKEIEAAGGVDFSMPVLLGYTGMSRELLDKYVRDSASVWADRVEKLPQTIVGSVVGTHAGPGAVAVAFFPMS